MMATPHAEDRTLWMGNLSESMSSDFVGKAFQKMGESVKAVRMVHDKYNGERAGYCFVELETAESARRSMLTLNGKVIPDSRPPLVFNLRFAFAPGTPSAQHCICASGLPLDYTEQQVFALFAKRYYSCRSARLLKTHEGVSKCIAIIRFADEAEHEQAILEMNRYDVRGRPIQVRKWYPRYSDAPRGGGRGGGGGRSHYDPVSHYSRFKDYYSSDQWQMYDYQSGGREADRKPAPESIPAHELPPEDGYFDEMLPESEQLEFYAYNIDVGIENMRHISRSEDLFRALEESRGFIHPVVGVATGSYADIESEYRSRVGELPEKKPVPVVKEKATTDQNGEAATAAVKEEPSEDVTLETALTATADMIS